MLSTLRYTIRIRTPMTTDPMTKAELELIHANISKTIAETMKLGAETSKINKEGRFYPIVAFGAIVAAGLASFVTVAIAIFRAL